MNEVKHVMEQNTGQGNVLTNSDDGGHAIPLVGRLGHTGVLALSVAGGAVKEQSRTSGRQAQLLASAHVQLVLEERTFSLTVQCFVASLYK